MLKHLFDSLHQFIVIIGSLFKIEISLLKVHPAQLHTSIKTPNFESILSAFIKVIVNMLLTVNRKKVFPYPQSNLIVCLKDNSLFLCGTVVLLVYTFVRYLIFFIYEKSSPENSNICLYPSYFPDELSIKTLLLLKKILNAEPLSSNCLSDLSLVSLKLFSKVFVWFLQICRWQPAIDFLGRLQISELKLVFPHLPIWGDFSHYEMIFAFNVLTLGMSIF